MDRRYFLILALLFMTFGAQSNAFDVVGDEIIRVESVVINKNKFTAYYTEKKGFYIVNSKAKKIFQDKTLSRNYKFIDFDGDGCQDILFEYLGNNTYEDLVLFDVKSNSFIKVKGFAGYPCCEKIRGTKYYYSYHRSGCADANWRSDLFRIENFQTIPIAYISGQGCVETEMWIYVYAIEKQKEFLVEKLPMKIIEQYKDTKWGFLNYYWCRYVKQ